MNEQLIQTMKNLDKNGIDTYFCETKEEVVPIIKTIINSGDKVACGGSVTLFECGVIDFLRSGEFNFLDRYAENLTQDEIKEILEGAYSADVYLCSSNAVTETGILYNVDGLSNRVSAIAYGAKTVVMVVGTNKIVNNIEEAITRVKTISAPKNTKRLNIKTYCSVEGRCCSLNEENSLMTDGCNSEGRICCNYLISAKQRIKGRIKVIFVNESLGY